MNEKLFELLLRGATTEGIKRELGIESYELAIMLNDLQNSGFMIKKTYHDRMGVKLFLNRNFNKNKPNDSIRLYTDSKSVRFLIISDTHLGNINDRLDLLDEIYNYALSNRIYTILHLGDLIEGYNPKIDNSYELKTTDAIEIAEYVVRYYPQDNSITNYILLGNHDFRTISNDGFDISRVISRQRLDMVILGYNDAVIELHQDSIGLQHPIEKSNNMMFDNKFFEYHDAKKLPALCLRGHMHEGLVYRVNNQPFICVPPLYNNFAKKPLGALDMTLYFNSLGRIDTMELQTLSVEPKIVAGDKSVRKLSRKHFF